MRIGRNTVTNSPSVYSGIVAVVDEIKNNAGDKRDDRTASTSVTRRHQYRNSLPTSVSTALQYVQLGQKASCASKCKLMKTARVVERVTIQRSFGRLASRWASCAAIFMASFARAAAALSSFLTASLAARSLCPAAARAASRTSACIARHKAAIDSKFGRSYDCDVATKMITARPCAGVSVSASAILSFQQITRNMVNGVSPSCPLLRGTCCLYHALRDPRHVAHQRSPFGSIAAPP